MSLLETLPASPKSEPPAMKALREQAHERLASEGLPTKKTEAWRFTSVAALTGETLAAGPSTLSVEAPKGVSTVERESLEALPAGPFAALNAALTDETVVLRAEGVVSEPLSLRYTGADHASYPRMRLEVAKGAELTLVERFEGEGALTDAVLELVLEDGARLRHVRIQRDAGRLIGSVSVTQGRDSHYAAHVITLGGALQRLDLKVGLDAQGASCDLRGFYAVDGSEHCDHHVRVDHRAPHGTSHQTFRGIADGKGVAVFDSQAIVHRTGGHAEAHQENRNLLLSSSAGVHTKPHLEIDHDEVVASHGATVGALDEDSLFYLRSRGIPADLARGILIHAFAHEPLTGMPDAFAKEVEQGLLERLPASEALADLGEELA
ncbi:MAG: Fe-S cluster assembly protein SufD [Deltaproteobacteria bacterium]|nr:Fe-S cluster assembly protein SufD [Deltaproteobacteria bacterium]